MSSLYLLIPLAIIMVSAAAGCLIWAVRQGQFDELQQYQDKLPDDF